MIKINYQSINTLFLDVGNTLISIDFNWVCEKLRTIGIECDSGVLQRAEAAARPVISSKIGEIKENPDNDIYIFYISSILEKLPIEIIKDIDSVEQVAQSLIPELFPEGNAIRLWSYVLPGTYEALNEFKAMGLQMHVISNADGTVEDQLIRSNLRDFFGEVIDSHIVQVEKPDPKIFEMALKMGNCKPHETLYVGDIYDVDIVGAESVGIQAVLIDPYSDWDGVECERVPDLLGLANNFKNKQKY